jgi:hypothetical protein
MPASVAVFRAFASESGFGGEKQKSISVKDYDGMKNCMQDRSKAPISIE